MRPAIVGQMDLERPFRIVAFDWDGTAVTGRREDARAVCEVLDRLLARGVAVVVITGTSLANTVSQLGPVIRGAHNRELYLATNRGSEIYGFDGRPSPVPLWRRTATPAEERRLTETADALKGRELVAAMPSDRVLTESDGPFVRIGPQSADPNCAPIVIQYLAKAWRRSEDDTARAILANLEREGKSP